MLRDVNPRTLYVSIGNSDDKLKQAEWATFCRKLDEIVIRPGTSQVLGVWHSLPDAGFQNHCIAVMIEEARVPVLYVELGHLAQAFGQDSIAVAEVAQTQFIGSPETVHEPYWKHVEVLR